MSLARETIMKALIVRLQAAQFAQPVNGRQTWASLSRRLKLWSETPRTQRPALFIMERHESCVYQSENLQPKTHLNVDLFVYIDSSDKKTIPAAALNILMDALAATLAPSPAEQGRQTLGGLVSHCRIDGQIMKDAGDLDGDGLLWVPLKILFV